jgi:hypothetical protein
MIGIPRLAQVGQSFNSVKHGFYMIADAGILDNVIIIIIISGVVVNK